MVIKWLESKVIHGQKRGKKLGFPTLNLDNPHLLKGFKKGVYAARVRINKKIHSGLLYFGPRISFAQTEDVLEIYILDFHQEVYGKTVFFRIIDYIRGVKKFTDTASYQKQLMTDIRKAYEILSSSQS